MIFLIAVITLLLFAGIACALAGNRYLWGTATETGLRRKMWWDLTGSCIGLLLEVMFGVVVGYWIHIGDLQSFFGAHSRSLLAVTTMFFSVGVLYLLFDRLPSLIDKSIMIPIHRLSAVGAFLFGIAGAILLLVPSVFDPVGVTCLIVGVILKVSGSAKVIGAISRRNRSVEAGEMTMLETFERSGRLKRSS